MKKILMLLSLICIMSCSEDKFNENYQQNEVRNKYHHYYGTADFLFNKSTNHPKLAQFLQENSVSLAMQKSGDTPTDIAINTDRVRVMSNDDVISYTFEVIEESENFEVRNLVIYHEVGNEEELYAYLFDYNLDENGSFELNDVSEFENTSFADCDDGNTELIMTLVVDCFPVNCMAGGNHEPGDTSCEAYGGSLGANIHCNIYHVAECTPGQGNTGGSSTGGSWDSGDGEGSNYTGGAGSGGNFGDGSSTSGGGVLTQPLGTKAQLSSILDLTRADLMSLDAEQADALLSFLYRNLDGFDVAQNAVDFALELLGIMVENPDITWSNIENWFLGEDPGSDSSEIIDPENISYDVPLTQQDLPSMSDFVNYFPKEGTPGNYTEMSTPDVYELVGGTLWHSHQNDTYNNYQNACSIRGSRGLLYSGIDIPVLTYNGSQRTQKGGDNNNYILDAVSFDKFMRDKFGSPTHELTGIDANNSGEVVDFLKDKNGIYVIINSSHTQAGYSGHVDAIIDGECISNAYAAPSGGVKSIAVWELE